MSSYYWKTVWKRFVRRINHGIRQNLTNSQKEPKHEKLEIWFQRGTPTLDCVCVLSALSLCSNNTQTYFPTSLSIDQIPTSSLPISHMHKVFSSTFYSIIYDSFSSCSFQRVLESSMFCCYLSIDLLSKNLPCDFDFCFSFWLCCLGVW
jgi:hypothetical protein